MLVISILGIIIILLDKIIEIKAYRWILNKFERDDRIKKSPGKGVISFFIGTTLVLLLFEKDIALASILILAIGDAASPLIAHYIGRTKNPLNNKKLLEGTIFAIIASFVAAAIFVNYLEAFVASTLAMIIESIDLEVYKDLTLDDNITIPLIAGTSIFLMRIIF